jgi:hypothetical protein
MIKLSIKDPVMVRSSEPSITTSEPCENQRDNRGNQRELVRINSRKGQQLKKAMVEVFGIDPQEAYGTKVIGCSDKEQVVTCRAPESYFLGKLKDIVTISLKFNLRTKEVWLKTYRVFTGNFETPFEMEEALVFGECSPFGSFSFPPELSEVIDLFYIDALGNQKSVYFKQGSKTILREKTYEYPESSPQSEWRYITNMHRALL